MKKISFENIAAAKCHFDWLFDVIKLQKTIPSDSLEDTKYYINMIFGIEILDLDLVKEEDGSLSFVFSYR